MNTLYYFSSSFFQNSQFTSLLASQTLLSSKVSVLNYFFFTYTHIWSPVHYMLKTPKFSSLTLSFISNVLVATIYLTTEKSKDICGLPFLKQNIDFPAPLVKLFQPWLSINATIFYPVIQAKILEVPLSFSHFSSHSCVQDTPVRLSSFTNKYLSKTFPSLSSSLYNIIFYFYLRSGPEASFLVYTLCSSTSRHLLYPENENKSHITSTPH